MTKTFLTRRLRTFLSFIIIFLVSHNVHALNPRDSKIYAEILTNRMIIELDLDNIQSKKCYNINYNYFRFIDRDWSVWKRNQEFSKILTSKQYEVYLNLYSYVYHGPYKTYRRPLYIHPRRHRPPLRHR